eukprot:7952973-Pyramimonas_sp.AAC.1
MLDDGARHLDFAFGLSDVPRCELFCLNTLQAHQMGAPAPTEECFSVARLLRARGARARLDAIG